MLVQTFKPVKIKLTSYDLELSRAGHRVGDTIEGRREYINDKPKLSVWFGSRNGAGDCVAYIGINCNLLK